MQTVRQIINFNPQGHYIQAYRKPLKTLGFQGFHKISYSVCNYRLHSFKIPFYKHFKAFCKQLVRSSVLMQIEQNKLISPAYNEL